MHFSTLFNICSWALGVIAVGRDVQYTDCLEECAARAVREGKDRTSTEVVNDCMGECKHLSPFFKNDQEFEAYMEHYRQHVGAIYAEYNVRFRQWIEGEHLRWYR